MVNVWRMRGATYDRVLILVIGLIARIPLGYIFYGGVDTNSLIDITRFVFHGQWLSSSIMWCYFPLLCLFEWFSGFLAIKIALPICFCTKFILLLFDAFMAVLIYDIVLCMRSKLAFRTGMLYALSPVGIIICAIHGQLDALALYPLLLTFYLRDFFDDSSIKFFACGCFFALSFLIKPYTLIFVFFLCKPYALFKQEMGKAYRYLCWFMGAIVAVAMVGFAVLKISKTTSIADFFQMGMRLPVVVGVSFLGLFFVLWVLYQSPWQGLSESFRHYLVNHAFMAFGIVATTVLVFGVLKWYGFCIASLLDTILRYSNQSAPAVGLPFAWPIKNSFLFVLLKNRLWTLIPIMVLAKYYYQGRFNVFQCMAFGFALILGACGLFLHYFVWLAPFLLIIGLYRLSAIYTLITSCYYLLYYANPWANSKFPYESVLGFVSLKEFSWLMPPVFFTQPIIVPLIHFFSNYFIPVICLTIAFYILYTGSVSAGRAYYHLQHSALRVLKNMHVWFVVVVMVGMVGCYFVVDSSGFGVAYDRIFDQRLQLYAVTVQNNHLTGQFPATSVGNIITIFSLWIIVWFWVAYNTVTE